MGKIVGITCGLQVRAYDGARNMLNHTYSQAIEKAGGIPLILPITDDPDTLSRYLDVIDGLLLTGGVDVHPLLYGEEEHPRLDVVDRARDATELPLIHEALSQDMPIFAICRGLQILNIALGGSLYQDLPTQNPSSIEHQQRNSMIPRATLTHSYEVSSGSRLASIVGDTLQECNSFHHQALKRIGEGLRVSATAPDGIVEGAEMPDKRYVVGVQFHPEDTAPTHEPSRRLFQHFVSVL
ncbi:MAG: gamma-glutamyl-gamma-aminobutyrate hydrolase family protein [Chthonomonadaceae bacterium]|nr:gamma-glutamyl-gamma-aminobutyrate hydrolase family protein [Chthonomonadaceae bacterium]